MSDGFQKQLITITDGKVLTLNGVSNIASFDEEYITLDTVNGKICVEGRALKIESLDKNGGNALICGEIEGVYRYRESSKKSLFGRFFG